MIGASVIDAPFDSVEPFLQILLGLLKILGDCLGLPGFSALSMWIA